MKYLYKYPQAAFPYADLVETNRGRSRDEFEYELLDTGVFDEDRYFDVFVEYAKAVARRHPDPDHASTIAARRRPTLHVLPTLWFRNQWSWHGDGRSARARQLAAAAAASVVAGDRMPSFGERYLYCDGDAAAAVHRERDEHAAHLRRRRTARPYVKDGINDYVVHGQQRRREPGADGHEGRGPLPRSPSPPGESQVDPAAAHRRRAGRTGRRPTAAADAVRRRVRRRRCRRGAQEADEFYAAVIPASLDADAGERHAAGAGRHAVEQAVLPLRRRQVARGARLRPVQADAQGRRRATTHWHHMYNGDVISMPDKWEYPWYAAWDLAFHVLAADARRPRLRQAAAEADAARALHAPQRADSGLRVELRRREPAGARLGDDLHLPPGEGADAARATRDWLKSCFQKLLLNFTWWVNRKDRSGRNVFEGGFLGLDNIGVFDRSAPLPTGGYLEQADGTAWMALFCQNMLEIAAELALTDPTTRTWR